jgi:hypothetical protein
MNTLPDPSQRAYPRRGHSAKQKPDGDRLAKIAS